MDCNKNEIGDFKGDTECIPRPVETNNNFESNKETSSSGGGDIESVPTDGIKFSESREERVKRLKEKSEADRQRRYLEIIESQRQANESRQKQQEDRRKRIEEIKQREEDRKRKAEQRRQEIEAKEKENNENLLRRTKEREARAMYIQKQIKMVPTMSQSMKSANQIRMTTSSHSNDNGSGSEKCKESHISPRKRSTSRPKTVHTTLVPTASKSPNDTALYDRLSKPRGVSQPPKSQTHEHSLVPQTNMSSSLLRHTSKAAKKLVAVPISGVSKKSSQKRKSLPISAPDSGLTSSPASEMESLQEPKNREYIPEIASDTMTDEIMSLKNSSKKNSKTRLHTQLMWTYCKNLHSKDYDTTSDSDNVNQAKVTSLAKEEELYRQKLTEQRRLARETKERQQEEQRRLEQEAKEQVIAEKKRIEEETRQIMEEEANRLRHLEEEELAALEKRKVDEEMERVKKEELERELEEKRMEKSRSEDTDRMERKRRLEKIMSRVKRSDESSSQSNEESALGITEFLESSVLEDRRTDPFSEMLLQENVVKDVEPNVEPFQAWTNDKEDTDDGLSKDKLVDSVNEADQEVDDQMVNNGSPNLLSENVLDLPGPDTNSFCMSHSVRTSFDNSQSVAVPVVPQFKSRRLQSMMTKGRLATSNSDAKLDTQITSSSDQLTVDDIADSHSHQTFITSPINGHLDNTDFVLQTRSCDNDISQIRDPDQSRHSLSYESQMNDTSLSHSNHHSDTENEVTLSSLASNIYSIVHNDQLDNVDTVTDGCVVTLQRQSPPSLSPSHVKELS